MKHYTVLANLYEKHGGLTNAALRRSCALVDVGFDVEVLVFNPVRDLSKLVETILEPPYNSKLKFHNLYSSVITHPGKMLSATSSNNLISIDDVQLPEKSDEQRGTETFAFTSETQSYVVREYLDFNNQVKRLEYLNRKFETVLIDERLPTNERFFTVVDHDNKNAAKFTSRELRRTWLESLIGSKKAVLYLDGRSPAQALSTYVKPNLIKFLIIHSNHLSVGESPTSGKLDRFRVLPFRHQQNFDRIITLTESQRTDLTERLGESKRFISIPNVNYVPDFLDEQRDSRRAVIVARIDENKRIGHMLEAIHAAIKAVPDLKVDVYGGPLEGDTWRTIRSLTKKLDLEKTVSFHGYSRAAADEFWTASFTLLTSASEAQALTLLEAMSRGCIPIAYDVKYGPSTTIDHDVNGWLVNENDIQTLAKYIVQVTKEDKKIVQMRHNARLGAQVYRPEKIATKYSEVITQVKETLNLRNLLRTGKAVVTSVAYEMGKDPSLKILVEFPERLPRKVEDVSFRISNHFNAKTRILPVKKFRVKGKKISLQTSFSNEDLKGLGRKHITGWLRVSSEGEDVDLRVNWPEEWSIWFNKSSTGKLNLK